MRFSLLLSSALVLFSCTGSASQRKNTVKTPTKAESPQKEGKADLVNKPRKEVTVKPLLLGWYCPEMAMGRPGVRPLWTNNGQWSDDSEELSSTIASRSVKRLSVLRWSGGLAGWFSVAGLATLSGQALAIGSYQGTSTCNAAAVGKASQLDPVCVKETSECGLAIGYIEPSSGFESRPYEEDPDSTSIAYGSGCEVGNVLVVDTDGDGATEKFLLDDLSSEEEAPVELPASSTPDTCTPSFGSVINDKLVRLATLDIDGDGRMEILFRRGAEEFLLYGAPNHPARLELLGRHKPTSE